MTELKRHMGLFHLVMYGVGLIVGAGIYVLIGEAAGLAGNAVWVSFVLSGMVAAFAGLSYAELTSMFPRAAAEYVFVKNALRSNFIGFIVGWLTSITSMITAATVALGFGGYFAQFLSLPITISAVLLLIGLSVINFFGIRESAWANTIFTIITISGLAIVIYLGFTFTDVKQIDYFEAPFGFSGIILAFVLIFFAFIGFEDMANVAEEVRNPKRTLPRGIILAIIFTSLIYILVSLASIRILGWQDLGESSAPLADVAGRVLGDSGQKFLSGIALFATASTVLITLIAGARMLYGMSRDGSLPHLLGRIHFKTNTPWIAVVVIMVASIGFAFIGDIVLVANIVVFAVVITFAMINLSVIVLRYTEPDMERPFKAPLNIGRFPVLALFGLIASIYMGLQFEIPVIGVGVGIIGAGVVFYFAYHRYIKKL
ncbi:MAG: amino acid permease [Thaumarchaeota archaeon]|nr:amino acid permease [Nitrososphaerota archaeon]